MLVGIYKGLWTRREITSQVWWHMLAMPAFRTLRQEDYRLKASMGYIARHWREGKGKKPSYLSWRGFGEEENEDRIQTEKKGVSQAKAGRACH